ncbi:hypothetical protein AMTRI_Chr05g69140 [Amborella trichopoda]
MLDLLLLLLIRASFQAISLIAMPSSITFTEPSNLIVMSFSISLARSLTNLFFPCPASSY